MSMTTNQPAHVESDAFTVRRSIHIAAPVDRVWATVTQPDLIARWFADTVTLDGTTPGSAGFFTFGDRSIPVRIEEVDEPHAIAYRWSNDDSDSVTPETIDDGHSVVMRFTLEADAAGTTLTVVESGFETSLDPQLNMREHERGWNIILDQLVAYLESAASEGTA